MNKFVSQLFEITLILILVYLVAQNASGFSSVLRAAGSTYTSAVRALQGR